MATVKTRLGRADQGRMMSLKEFREAQGEPGYLYELARGVVNVVETPGDGHTRILDKLHDAWVLYRYGNPGLIDWIAHASDVRLVIPRLESDRHPDLAIVFEGAEADARGRRIPGLAVEVVSRGRASRVRDYEEKREEYLAYGLREYWIVDPLERVVIVLVRADGPSWVEKRFEGSDTIVSGLLPDFGMIVDQLWIDAEFGEDEAG